MATNLVSMAWVWRKAMKIECKHIPLSTELILKHLERTDRLFVPNLSSYVDLGEYANKLSQRAHHISAWSETRLVALLSFYTNADSKELFVSNLSVESAFQGKGIAAKLLDQLEQWTEDKEWVSLVLDVFALNEAAVRFYQQHGFTTKSGDQKLTMRKLLRK